MTDVVALLRELVRVPSESRDEAAVVGRLVEIFRELGWGTRRSGNNIYAFLGDEGPLLLLNSHTDTVPVGEGWTVDPLAADVVGGKVFGRGANDAKGCLAAMIVGAANAFAKAPPKGRVCLAATCEEEVTGQGLEALVKELPRPDAAVVGEPTGLNPAVAQKGLLLLTLTARGVSAHAAHGGGVNAIEAAARDVLALAGVAFEREHPALGKPTLRVTQIQGGERHNVVPDRCRLVVDIRTTPAYSPAELVALVRGRVESEVEVRSQRLESVDTDPGHAIVRAALAANPKGRPYGSPTLSDWVFLKGVPTVKAGPGDSKRSHAPDEYVTVDELREGAAFYERLIREYLA